MTEKKIAVVFDFDDTLTPDSTSAFLQFKGVDVIDFWKNKVQKLDDDGWDPILAYMFQMIELSKSGSISPISLDDFRVFGKQINFFRGVEKMFDILRKHISKTHPSIEIEFYLISSGIGDIIRSTSIAKYFTAIWASEFHYTKEGEIYFPKKAISFTDKTRYIFQITKGIYGDFFNDKPFEVNKKTPYDKLRIKPHNMIVVGDGYTDIPCFSLVKRDGGYAIGVYDKSNKQKWGKAWGFIEDDRVSNLVSANYSTNSDLMNSLFMALDRIAIRLEEV